jgi:hypothetical protein
VKTPILIIALLSTVAPSAFAQSPAQASITADASNNAAQESSLIKRREVALNAELTLGSLGAGVEASFDLGYIGVAGGVTAGSSDFGFGDGELFDFAPTTRKYVMVRAQTPGIVAGYIGVGPAVAKTSHVDGFHIGGWNPGDTVSYTEESNNIMSEIGAKVQIGNFSGRAYVGVDTELDTNCIESEGHCDHQPVYGGISLGIALH